MTSAFDWSQSVHFLFDLTFSSHFSTGFCIYQFKCALDYFVDKLSCEIVYQSTSSAQIKLKTDTQTLYVPFISIPSQTYGKIPKTLFILKFTKLKLLILTIFIISLYN